MVPKFAGTLGIYDTPEEAKRMFRGGPESVTGFALQLNVPLGELSEGAATDVYGHLFNKNSEKIHHISLVESSKFSAIVHPTIQDFAWRMNQAKNAGFAITPQVKMTLHFEILGADKTIVFSRDYASGWVDGASYMVNFSPLESVDDTVHKTLADLMKQSVIDMEGTLNNNPSITSTAVQNQVGILREPVTAALSFSNLKVVSYQYDSRTLKGSLSVNIAGHGIEARDWVVENIGKICSTKDVLLESGQEEKTGGRFRVLNESIRDGILTIEFSAGYNSN